MWTTKPNSKPCAPGFACPDKYRLLRDAVSATCNNISLLSSPYSTPAASPISPRQSNQIPSHTLQRRPLESPVIGEALPYFLSDRAIQKGVGRSQLIQRLFTFCQFLFSLLTLLLIGSPCHLYYFVIFLTTIN